MPKGANNAKITRIDKTFNTQRPRLVPLNPLQNDYIQAIRQNSVVLATGVAGSSKSYCCTRIAIDCFEDKNNPIDKIIIARPAEGKGKSIGFLKGSAEEKLLPWCMPIIATLKEIMGEGQVNAHLEYGKIEMLPLEMIKGRTFDNTFIIVDEAEDIDVEVIKSLLLRQGQNSKLVITGDIAQQDLKRHSGLQYILDVIKHTNLPIPHIDFDSWDYCVRSDECKMWGQAFQAFDNK